MDHDTPQKTHFGYQQVNVEDKAGRVAEVFHSVAARYDLMNDLMSGGIHRLWKRFAIEVSAVRAGQKVLDIAGGTGNVDVTAAGNVVLAIDTDISTTSGAVSLGAGGTITSGLSASVTSTTGDIALTSAGARVILPVG